MRTSTVSVELNEGTPSSLTSNSKVYIPGAATTSVVLEEGDIILTSLPFISFHE